MNQFIVLVEDNPDDELLIQRIFRKYRITNEMLVFHDGTEALEFLTSPSLSSEARSQLPELILLSLKLPKISGMEVLRRIREEERTKHLPVILLTSSNEEGQSLVSSLAGPQSRVCKPVDFVRLSRAFNELGLSWTLLNASVAVEGEVIGAQGDGPLARQPD